MSNLFLQIAYHSLQITSNPGQRNTIMSRPIPRDNSDRPPGSGVSPAPTPTKSAPTDYHEASVQPLTSDSSEKHVPPIARVQPLRATRPSSKNLTRAPPGYNRPRTIPGEWHPYGAWDGLGAIALTRLQRNLSRTLDAAVLMEQCNNELKGKRYISPEVKLRSSILESRLSGFIFLLKEFLVRPPPIDSGSNLINQVDWSYVRPATDEGVVYMSSTTPEAVESTRPRAPRSRASKRRARRIKAKSFTANSDKGNQRES